MKWLIILPLFLALTLTNPIEKEETLEKVLQKAQDDTLQMIESKNAALEFVAHTLNEAGQEFDSQKVFKQGTGLLASGLNATTGGLEFLGNATGIFDAFNNIIQSIAAFPSVVMNYIKGPQNNM